MHQDKSGGGARDDLGSQAKDMARSAASAASGAVHDARRWAEDHAPRRLEGDEVRDTLLAAGRQAMSIVRERPLLALGVLAAFAFVLGRSNRDSSPHRRGIWF
jgi:ElaB/YqjD/DUF883 family membrane-anchored ribosome-binding protein